MTSKVDQFLSVWHKTVEQKNIKLIDPLVSNKVILSSPALFKPKEGKAVVMPLLTDVLATLEGYKISKTWIDGNEIILEFDARVGEKTLQGIDRITLDSEGKIEHLKVYIRPYKGLQALISAIVQINIARAEEKMSWSKKLVFKATYLTKMKLQSLLE